MKNKHMALMGILGLGLTLAAVSSVSAADVSQELTREEVRAQRTEHRDEMQEIFENKDFSAWQEQMAERHEQMLERHKMQEQRHEQMLNAIDSEEDFAKLVEMHEKMRSGDKEAAEEIREELGLPEHKKMGKRMGKRGGDRAHRVMNQ